MKGGLGLSHTLGYALGSPYGIPHGVTSCLTLGEVVKLKGRAGVDVGMVLEVLGEKRTRSTEGDGERVGSMVNELVERVGEKTTLSEKGVGKDEVEVILKRASGGLSEKEGRSEEEEKQIGELRKLVEGLF